MYSVVTCLNDEFLKKGTRYETVRDGKNIYVNFSQVRVRRPLSRNYEDLERFTFVSSQCASGIFIFIFCEHISNFMSEIKSFVSLVISALASEAKSRGTKSISEWMALNDASRILVHPTLVGT